MATVLVNQVPHDFASMEVDVIGVNPGGPSRSFGILTALDEIEYTTTINREKIYGTSRLPILRTLGDAEFDGSITMHRHWWDYIVAQSVEMGIPLIELRLVLGVSYFSSGIVTTDTLTDIAIAEISNSASRGPEPLMVGVPIDPMNIFFNGVDLLGNRLA